MRPSDEIWLKVLESFAVEHRDHLLQLQRLLAEVELRRYQQDTVSEAKRSLHSLKGTSRLLQFRMVEQLCHCGETLLARWDKLGVGERQSEADWLQRLCDAIEDAVTASLEARASISAQAFLEELATMVGQELEVLEAGPEADRGRGIGPVVRVSAAQLESFIRTCGRIGHQPSLIQEYLLQLRTLEDQLQAGPRAHFRRLLGGLERVGRELSTASVELREDSRRLTLIPARDLFGGLATQVRELAQQRGKEVDIQMEGLDTLVEMPLLQALLEPMNHLIGNAIHHGLESATERVAAGKPARGRISLRLQRRDEDLVVSFSDDGRGLQHDQLIRRAQALGRYHGQSGEELIFIEGLSSEERADQLAGRGIGMSAVLNRVKELGGRLRLSGNPGLTVEMHFASGFWGMSVLTVKIAQQWFALPSQRILGVRRVPRSALIQDSGRFFLLEGGRPLPVISLSGRLQLSTEAPAGQLLLVEVSDAQEKTALLAVSDWGVHRSVVLQPIPGGGWPEDFLEGGFLLGSGEVCLVLNLDFLLQELHEGEPVPVRTREPLVLVVDDSQTTRQLTAAILGAEGFRTVQADNGLSALEVLRAESVDLVISDVQMPRMDGLMFVRELRQVQKNRELPVILLSSLAQASERRQGLEAGADAYLVKQNFDHRELVETVKRFL